MKTFATPFCLFVVTLIATMPVLAQGALIQDDHPAVGIGTVLTYNVKENRMSYNYIITITKFSEHDDIAFDWKTDEAIARYGHSSMNYNNLTTANSLLVKIGNSNEIIRNNESRIFLSEFMTHDISDHLAAFTIDGNERNFLFVDMNYETKKVPVNNIPVSLREHSGEDITYYIGVIDMKNARILGHYISPDLSIDLTAIDNKEMSGESPVPDEKNQEKGKPKKMGTVDLIFAQVMFPALALIEDYDPTNGGKIKKPFHETYDYRLDSKADIPPSYVDAFIVDLKYIYQHKVKFSKYITGNFEIGEKDFPEDEILKVLNVYLNVDARELYGYRPWTNQQFVKSLTEEDRKKLAGNAASYIMMYGFKEK